MPLDIMQPKISNFSFLVFFIFYSIYYHTIIYYIIISTFRSNLLLRTDLNLKHIENLLKIHSNTYRFEINNISIKLVNFSNMIDSFFFFFYVPILAMMKILIIIAMFFKHDSNKLLSQKKRLL